MASALQALFILQFLLLCTAQLPPSSVSLTVSTGPNSLDILWAVIPAIDASQILRTYFTAVYSGPCLGIELSSREEMTNPRQRIHTISNLEEFSDYRVNVTVVTVDEVVTAIEIFRTRGTGPRPPANFRFVAATTTTITVEWDPIPCLDLNSRIESYNLHIVSMNIPTTAQTMVFEDTSVSLVTAESLMAGTSYSLYLDVTYSISDEDTPVRGATSTQINASTFAIPGPYALHLNNTQNQAVAVSWQQEEPTDMLSRYDIEAMYIGPCTILQTPVMQGIPISSRIYTFENLLEFGTYQITVTAVSFANQRASSSIRVQTLPTVPQSSPPSLHASNVEAFSITLTWDTISCTERRSEISNYSLSYVSQQHNDSQQQISNITGIGETTIVVMNLTELTTYIFQVSAVNREGLVGPTSTVTVTTRAQPPAPSNLVVISTQARSVVLYWSQTTGLRYTVISTYVGPCTDVRIPPRTLEVEGSLALHNITGLEEYSQYVVRVTPHGGRLTASVNVTTLSAAPSPSDDHISYISSTMTSVTLSIPHIDCIDQNGNITEFRIKYAPTQKFNQGMNIRNGIFSPGILTIGNLLPGTNYTFQLIIHTAEGESAVLVPISAITQGTAPLTTMEPTSVDVIHQTSDSSTGISPEIISTIVVVVVGIAVILALVVIVLCYLVKKGSEEVSKAVSDKESSDRQKLIEKVENWMTLGVNSERPSSFGDNRLKWMSGLGAASGITVYENAAYNEMEDFELAENQTSFLY